MEFDLKKEKVGELVKGDPTKHLKRMNKMIITLGPRRSWIEILGAESPKGRPRIRKELILNTSLGRQARFYANKFKIIRQNIEVIREENS